MSNINLDHRQVWALLSATDAPELDTQLWPIVPLDSPEMPPAGPDFIAHAVNLGDDATEIENRQKKKKNPVTNRLTALCRYALYSRKFKLPVATKQGVKIVDFLPGHLAKYDGSSDDVFGPKPARTMVVLRNPGPAEIARGDYLDGEHMAPFFKAIARAGISTDALGDWYITAACKFHPPLEVSALPAAWLKDCAWLLAQEIQLVNPEFILCCGPEATKAVLNTKGAVSSMYGRVIPITAPRPDAAHKEILVTPTHSPVLVHKKPELLAEFSGHVKRFNEAITQTNTAEETDFKDIYTADELKIVVDAMLADTDPNANIIAVDCEWHGDHPTEDGAYLRTIQFSNKDKWARNVILRHQGGAVAFKPDLDAARAQLLRLLKSTDARHVRVGGHFLRADLPWLLDFGVDLRPEYAPSADPEDRLHGGWDTSLMYHAINETARFGLDACSVKFTSAPIYWADLDDWKKNNKEQAKGGYGNIPPYILHEYAAYDADVTRRIMLKFYGTDGTDGLLSSDKYGHDCWRPYWVAHNASLAFLEMELTGLVVDKTRADELTTLFINTRDRLLAEVREELGWPDFNPKSQPQLAVALFGRAFSARYTNPPTIPENANLLDLVPVKTTGKRPTLWRDLNRLSDEKRRTATPSTDKESLGILGYQNATAAKIRDYKFIGQVLQSTLRQPQTGKDGDYVVDEDGNYSYDKGLVGSAHKDGKVRTHFFQTKETGRASSSRPPLQNLSSRREEDYARIIGESYRHPVRSILRVPAGHVGIETDLTGAELAVLAWLSQDVNMIEHVRRNLLPDTHPDHYDIHARQAVKTFHITDVEPTARAMKKAGKKGLRVAAKNVNFGIPYGRGAVALARQCQEEGHDVSARDCEKMIEAYFDSYPAVADFLQECRARSQDPGWIVGPYGRYRRFIKSKDRIIRSEQERQAQNFPIQGAVADAVSIALSNFYNFRENNADIDYKVCLQIHDAIVLVVPLEHAQRVYEEVVPKCMVEDVPFTPCRLDGTKISAGPYMFGSSREVFVHWGELLTADEAADLGLDFLAEELSSEGG